MPKYTFECQSCNTSRQQYTSSKIVSIKCNKCDSDMERRLPTLSGPADVTEIVNDYTGLVHREDQQEVVKQRRDEYYWSIEVPRMVNSGVYSVETMLEMGWIYLDDKDKVQINTVPPHRR